MFKILFIGDIVGSGGRNAVRALVPKIREEHGIGFCIANGENMAAGNGFSKSCLEEMKDSGVDVFTGGDHTWDQKDFVKDIELFQNLIRPANVSALQPGRGFGIFDAANGMKVGVISLMGRTFMGVPSDCPFNCARRIVNEIRQTTPIIIVDFHAEATSDKAALARYLDGDVTAVIGTHTHVATADETILSKGTAFQTDAGMVGSRDSVLGRDPAAVINRYVTGMPARFNVVNENIRMNAVIVECDEATGHTTNITRISHDL